MSGCDGVAIVFWNKEQKDFLEMEGEHQTKEGLQPMEEG